MNQLTDRNPQGPPDAADYASDFVAWIERRAALLREGQFSELDREKGQSPECLCCWKISGNREYDSGQCNHRGN